MVTRKPITIKLIEEEYQEYLDKVKVIKDAGLIATQRHIFLTGLNRLYDRAKQFIDSE